jgi:hypothetical protein
MARLGLEAPSFLDYASGRVRAMETATQAGVRAGTEGLRRELREALNGAGIKPVVGNMIAQAVYPKTGASLGAAGTVFGRGERAQFILWALSQTEAIRAKGGRYLAIPTSYNRAGGRRGAAVRLSAAAMYGMKGMTFVRPIRSGISQYAGGKLWFLRVQVAEQRRETVRTTKTGKERRYVSTRKLAFAGGLQDLQVGGTKQSRVELITGARASNFPAGAVPMFLLVPVVTPSRRHEPDALARKWAGLVPQLIDQAMPE